MSRAEPIILVATWDHGIFAIIGNERMQEIADTSVRGLAPDGRGGALAIVGRNSLRRRTPDGEWTTLATSEFDLSCCVAVPNDIYTGTDDARVLRLSHESDLLFPINSFDTTEGRDTWFAGSAIVNGERLGPPLGIRSVAANSDGSVLFANVHVGGIPRSMDRGETWRPTIDIHSDVHEVRAHPDDPNIVAAASGSGLCISRDAGATWLIERDGLHASHCSAVAFTSDEILVSAATNQFAEQGKVYRRSLGPAGHITPAEDGLPTWTEGIVDTSCIAVTGSAVAMVDRAGNLYVSTECGRTWSRNGGKLPSPSSVLIC